MRIRYLFVALGVVSASPAWAQSDPEITIADRIRDNLITVVATGDATRVANVGQSISIIGSAEIDAIQGPDIVRVLDRSPGVSATRNGGTGAFTGVRIRGSASEQVLVLLDGVRIADIAAPGSGFDFGTVLAGEIGRVEVLRGSNSVVWGSDAIGGVIALTSRTPEGIEASAEYGSHRSFAGQGAWGLKTERATLRLGGGYARSDGISAAASGTERDGFRQWNLHGAGELALGGGFTALATARYADGKLDIDGYPPPLYAFADTAEFQNTRQLSTRGGLRWEGEALRIDAGYAWSQTRRALTDPAGGSAPYFTSKGTSGRAELTGTWRLAPQWTLDFGADRQRDRFATGPTFGSSGAVTLASGHALLGWQGDAASLFAGVRYDHHSRFGGAWTLGANGSVALGKGWRARASYGEGFKAPTLFQLLSDFGNPLLTPERSRSYDVGIEHGDRNAPLHMAITAFRRDSRDLIDFVSCFGASGGICTNRPFGTYDNVGRARAEGVELELGAAVSDRFRAGAAYSYVKTTSRDTGLDLARRPRHALTLSADWTTPLAGLALGADLRLVSDSFDDAFNTVRLDGHALTTLRADVPLGERFELYGRIENLADVRYQTAAGYGTERRAGYIGARARF